MLDIKNILEEIDKIDTIEPIGQVAQITGLVVESIGPVCSIGEICEIHTRTNGKILAEVVGFKQNRLELMPLGNLYGISPGDKVITTNKPLSIKLSTDLQGKILDGLGNIINKKENNINIEEIRTIVGSPPDALKRPRINKIISTGVRAIDGILTLGQGQRVGIFAGSGVGKSMLLGMIARNSSADINVICLVGERGREVNDFIEKDLGTEGMKKSVVVVATSDQPSIIRVKSGLVATTIAEFFRDKGYNVMFMMDSVTRIAIALREIGLAIGEPPTTKAYTPSVFAFLPGLLERAGTSPAGSITGIYTVLVEGEDMEDPIADHVRSILDGHIVLTRKLANKKHFPAIDVLQSVSRLMIDIVPDEHYQLASNLTNYLARYYEIEDLINIGAYIRGNNKENDKAIELFPKIEQFLRQHYKENSNYEEALQKLKEIFK